MMFDGSMVPPSPLAVVFDRLRAMSASWDVALGEPEGAHWIRGTDLAAPDRGKLRDLLDRIGAHLETSNRTFTQDACEFIQSRFSARPDVCRFLNPLRR